MLGEKIFAHTARIGVIGLGYVGLPFAILVGQRRFPVLGIDLDKERVASLKAGKSYISDIADGELNTLQCSRNFQISFDYSELPACDVIVICVPTPLVTADKPDYSLLIKAVAGIAATLRPEQLVIVESTVAPGTTAEIVLPLLESGGLRAGVDFYLAYSPERIDPGNKNYSLSNTPKLVAGLTLTCQSLASHLYQCLGLTVVPAPTLATAEMAKLLENTYRDINIAFINEMAQVCRRSGLNIWQVIEAAATKPFGFQAFYPGPGVGGHCIPVDSVYYSFWARTRGWPAELAEHARRVNAHMPFYVATLVRDVLQNKEKTIKGSKILILGVTYKKDIEDVRESPILELIHLLRDEGAIINFHDPAVESIGEEKTVINRSELTEEVISNQDCVVFAVAHSSYQLAWLYGVSSLIVDLTNGFAEFPPDKIIRL